MDAPGDIPEAEWRAALERVVAHTRHEPYRAKCEASHPDHAAWRRRIVARAAALDGTPAPEYPPFARQAGNALAAAGRVVAAVASGRPVFVAPEERERRARICAGCDQHDAARDRCFKCGCGELKRRLATESQHCPLDKW